MFPSLALLAAFLSAVPSIANAYATPTSPDSTTVVKVGGEVTALWNADTTGEWTKMTIQLMSGSNLAMVPLSTVGQDIDATTTTNYTFTAPDVTPNAAIYFLQFTNDGNTTNTQWTTRWTIAAADGTTTSPANSTQNGEDIPWGIGTLVDDSSSNSTSTAASSAVVSSAAASSSVASSESASASSAAVVTASTTSSSMVSSIAASNTVAAVVSTAASAVASTTSKTSGASRLVGVSLGAAFVAGVVTLAL